MDTKKEMLKIFENAYNLGFNDCIDSIIQSLQTMIDANVKGGLSPQEIITIMEASKTKANREFDKSRQDLQTG